LRNRPSTRSTSKEKGPYPGENTCHVSPVALARSTAQQARVPQLDGECHAEGEDPMVSSVVVHACFFPSCCLALGAH